MKRKLNILITLIFTFLIIGIYTSRNVSAKEIDITTSSVREDLASMGKDNLSNISDVENIFISFGQYYDKNDDLRTYLYMNYVDENYNDLFVNISSAVSDEYYNITENFNSYPLKFVSKDPDCNWFKFEVLDLPNLIYTTRRYYIKNCTLGSNGLEEVLSVEQVYIFHGLYNDTMEVFNQEYETITITEYEYAFYAYGPKNSFHDFLGIKENMAVKGDYTDAWYVFFNTDKKIDELLEVELIYEKFDYYIRVLGYPDINHKYNEEYFDNYIAEKLPYYDEIELTYDTEPTKVVVTPGEVKISAGKDKWFRGYKTKYTNIDKIIDLKDYHAKKGDEFVFTNMAEKYSWGCLFLNTSKTSRFKGDTMMGMAVDTVEVNGSTVNRVAILRLKFVTDGIVKNLYAVSEPLDDFIGIAVPTLDDNILDTLGKILKIIGILILVVIGSSLLSLLLPILSILWKIITIPFNMIKKIVNRINRKKNE